MQVFMTYRRMRSIISHSISYHSHFCSPSRIRVRPGGSDPLSVIMRHNSRIKLHFISFLSSFANQHTQTPLQSLSLSKACKQRSQSRLEAASCYGSFGSFSSFSQWSADRFWSLPFPLFFSLIHHAFAGNASMAFVFISPFANRSTNRFLIINAWKQGGLP